MLYFVAATPIGRESPHDSRSGAHRLSNGAPRLMRARSETPSQKKLHLPISFPPLPSASPSPPLPSKNTPPSAQPSEPRAIRRCTVCLSSSCHARLPSERVWIELLRGFRRHRLRTAHARYRGNPPGTGNATGSGQSRQRRHRAHTAYGDYWEAARRILAWGNRHAVGGGRREDTQHGPARCARGRERAGSGGTHASQAHSGVLPARTAIEKILGEIELLWRGGRVAGVRRDERRGREESLAEYLALCAMAVHYCAPIGTVDLCGHALRGFRVKKCENLVGRISVCRGCVGCPRAYTQIKQSFALPSRPKARRFG